MAYNKSQQAWTTPVSADTPYPEPDYYGNSSTPSSYPTVNEPTAYGGGYSDPYKIDMGYGQEGTTNRPPGTGLYRMDSTGEPSEDPLGDFTEKSLRRGFIRKVFGILAIQLLFTFGAIALFVKVESLQKFSEDNPWMLIASSITTIVLVIALACSEKIRRQFPQNLICLAVFTLAESWMLGTIAGTYKADEVLMAAGICAGITVVMCLFGFQSKIDFTMCLGAMLALTLCLMAFGILCLIFQDRYLQLMYASLGALIFSVWIAVDVQMVTAKGKYSYDGEEYILAALNIYLDIINLFLMLLALVGKK